MPRNYWMLTMSPENFQITRGLGFKVQAVRASQKKKVQRIEPGDRILFYIDGDRRFAATATATSKYFEDRSPTWKTEAASEWAYRVHIQPEIVLDDADFMDAYQLAPRLDYVRRWSPEDWYVAFAQTHLHILPKKDFVLVEQEMRKVKTARSRGPRRQPAPAPSPLGQDGPARRPGAPSNASPSASPDAPEGNELLPEAPQEGEQRPPTPSGSAAQVGGAQG